MNNRATVTGIVANPDTPEAELTVEIAVDCPMCGPGMIRIPGHHLQLVYDAAKEYLEKYPDLTKATIRLVQTHEFTTSGPQRPEDN